MIKYFLLGFVILSALLAGSSIAAPDTLGGRWVLNEELSDDVQEAVDGKMRRIRSTPGGSRGRGGDYGADDTGYDVTQESYWEAVRDARERRSMKDLRRLGTAYPLLTATELQITARAADFDFLYDELLLRHVRPNPAGRIYSAKGDELVSDSIGYTLAYWDQDQLVLETNPPTGGMYIERLSLPAGGARLEYRVRLEVLALEEPVEIRRVFERRSADDAVR